MGTYECEYVKTDSFGRLIIVSHEHSIGGADLGTEVDYSINPDSRTTVYAVLDQLQPGDKIEVDVEFNNYTVVAVRSTEFDPRVLHERISKMEKWLNNAMGYPV